MTIHFILASLFYVLALYVPAYYFLTAIQTKQQELTIGITPAISISLFSILGILYYPLGIPANPISIVGTAGILLIAAGAIIRIRNGRAPLEDIYYKNAWIVILYIVVGAILTKLIFVDNLQSLNSLHQDSSDNGFHLNVIRSMAQSSNMSSLSVSKSEHWALASDGAGFYPAAWHMLAALAMQAIQAQPTVCINALNAALIAVVFPLGIYSFLNALNPESTSLQIIGAFTSLSICICPWEFLIWGPLYSNLLGLVLIPGVAGYAVGKCATNKLNVSVVVIFCFGCIAIALGQPNCIFTLAIILIPALIRYIYINLNHRLGVSRTCLLIATLTAAFIVIWIAMQDVSIFKNVTKVNWAPQLTGKDAFLSLINLSLMFHPGQPIVVAFVLIGTVYLFYKKENRWVLFPALYFAIAYAVCISTEGELRRLLSGYWYNDYYRMATMFGLALVPILTIGVDAVIEFLETCLSRLPIYNEKIGMSLVLIGTIALYTAFVYTPAESYPSDGYQETAFGIHESTIAYQYTFETPVVSLTGKGEEFLQKVAKIAGTNDLVINNPNDGSIYAYGLNNINTYYRGWRTGSGKYSKTIRKDLNNYAIQSNVQQAVKSLNAKYVLQLDAGKTNPYGIRYYDFYKPKAWKGINEIDSDTPGFKLVLSEDNMRLYEIER